MKIAMVNRRSSINYVLYLTTLAYLCAYLLHLDSTRLNVWIMDGDVTYQNLLKFAITKKSAKDVTVIIIVDMSKPWTIMDTLNSWIRVLREHIHSLSLSPKDLNEMEHHSKFSLGRRECSAWSINVTFHRFNEYFLDIPVQMRVMS